jgi:hypothetical protein
MSIKNEMFELQIVEANHAEDTFWVLAVGEFESKDEIDEKFHELPAAPRLDDSERDYIIDKMVDGDIVEDKFVSAETVERITGRKIGRMRAGAKNSLRAEIRRWDKKKVSA